MAGKSKAKEGSAVNNDEMLPVLPASVIDIARQGKRPYGDQSKKSSRSAYSGFPSEVVDLAYSLFLRDCTTIFDPFAGWGERGEGAKKYGKRYLAVDTSPDAVAMNDLRGVTIRQADAQTCPVPAHDGLFTCPPYWNLERYAGPDYQRLRRGKSFYSEWRRCFAGLLTCF